jgi:hypothetical protein
LPSVTFGRAAALFAVLPLVLVAACGGSRSTATSSASLPPGTMSKAVTITQLDAVCKATDAKITALPVAKGRSDYPALLSDFTGTLAIFQAYFAQVQLLVDQSVDRARLTSKWLALEQGDFAVSQPILEQMVQAIQAKDDASIAAAQKKLSAAPDHTDEIISFFRSYGLKDCVTMQAGQADS